MPSTVEQISPSRVKLTIELPFDDLKPSLDRAYAEIAQQVNIPGFRKGKVPARIIDQRFGRGLVLQEAINDALPDAYGKAVVEHQLAPLGQPEVEITQLEDGAVVMFTAEVDVRPDFTVPELSGIQVQVEKAEISDADLDERVDMLRQRFATYSEVDRAAAEDDVVVIDLLGRRDGEPVDEATADGISYKVGSQGMLEGLDDAVKGLKAGESATFTSTLVGGPLQGEEMDIDVTVQKVQQTDLPEIDDEFAQMVSQFDTVAEMKDDLRNGLEQSARFEQLADARDKVLEAVIEQLDFEVPERIAADEAQARKDQITQQLGQAGLTLETYLAESQEADSEEAFWADVEQRSAQALKAQLLLDKIADDDEIGVDQAELTQAIMRKAQANGTTPEQEANHMMEHNHMAEWMQEIRRGKALDKLVKGAVVADADGHVLDIARLENGEDGTTDEIVKPAKKTAAKKTTKKAAAKAAEPAEGEAAEVAEAAPAKKAAAKKTTKKAAKATEAVSDAEEAAPDAE